MFNLPWAHVYLIWVMNIYKFQAGVEDNISIMSLGNTQGAMFALKKMKISNGGAGGRIVTTASVLGLQVELIDWGTYASLMFIWAIPFLSSDSLADLLLFRVLDWGLIFHYLATELQSGEIFPWPALLLLVHPAWRLTEWRAMLWLHLSQRQHWQGV